VRAYNVLQVDVSAAYELMKEAFKFGINFFDNAEIYEKGESERVMGECIKKGIEDGVWLRCVCPRASALLPHRLIVQLGSRCEHQALLWHAHRAQ
jgi:predicted oxidoreductase